MLAIVGLLAMTIPTTFSVFELEAHWWTWLCIVATGAFAGRLIVELWKPELADKSTDVTTFWQRWRRLGIAWLVLAMTGIAGGLVLFLTRVTMV